MMEKTNNITFCCLDNSYECIPSEDGSICCCEPCICEYSLKIVEENEPEHSTS